jgi:hypothetical protein
MAMRTISASILSTPTIWLPTMSNITPPNVRRESATQKMSVEITNLPDRTPQAQTMNHAHTTTRLKSRKPFYNAQIPGYDEKEQWRWEWQNNLPEGRHIITDPTKLLPGFQESNRLISKHGKTASKIFKWGMFQSPTCLRCGSENQTVDHIVLRCSETAISGGYQTILDCEDTYKTWLQSSGVEVSTPNATTNASVDEVY